MSDITKIKTPDGVTHTIRDPNALRSDDYIHRNKVDRTVYQLDTSKLFQVRFKLGDEIIPGRDVTAEYKTSSITPEGAGYTQTYINHIFLSTASKPDFAAIDPDTLFIVGSIKTLLLVSATGETMTDKDFFIKTNNHIVTYTRSSEKLAFVSDIPALDTTLSESGKPADAKATGESIAAVASDVTELDTSVNAVAESVATKATKGTLKAYTYTTDTYSIRYVAHRGWQIKSLDAAYSVGWIDIYEGDNSYLLGIPALYGKLEKASFPIRPDVTPDYESVVFSFVGDNPEDSFTLTGMDLTYDYEHVDTVDNVDDSIKANAATIIDVLTHNDPMAGMAKRVFNDDHTVATDGVKIYNVSNGEGGIGGNIHLVSTVEGREVDTWLFGFGEVSRCIKPLTDVYGNIKAEGPVYLYANRFDLTSEDVSKMYNILPSPDWPDGLAYILFIDCGWMQYSVGGVVLGGKCYTTTASSDFCDNLFNNGMSGESIPDDDNSYFDDGEGPFTLQYKPQGTSSGELAKKTDLPDVSGKVDKVDGFGVAAIGTPSSYGAFNLKVQKDDGTQQTVGLYNKDALDKTVLSINTAISAKASTTSLTSHTGNKSNPHSVTAQQVGAYTKSEVDTKLGDKLGTTATAADSSKLGGVAASGYATKSNIPYTLRFATIVGNEESFSGITEVQLKNRSISRATLTKSMADEGAMVVAFDVTEKMVTGAEREVLDTVLYLKIANDVEAIPAFIATDSNNQYNCIGFTCSSESVDAWYNASPGDELIMTFTSGARYLDTMINSTVPELSGVMKIEKYPDNNV